MLWFALGQSFTELYDFQVAYYGSPTSTRSSLTSWSPLHYEFYLGYFSRPYLSEIAAHRFYSAGLHTMINSRLGSRMGTLPIHRAFG